MSDELDLALHNSPFVIFRWRNCPAWTTEYVSPNIRQLFGYEPSDFLRGKIHYDDLLHPDDLPTAARAVAEAAKSEDESFEQEYRIRKGGDGFVWVRDRTCFVRSLQGEITHFQGYIWEITRQKEAEAALHQLNLSLEKRIEKTLIQLRERDAALIQQSRHAALGEMIGNIAHQWRQPLNALAILVQDIQDGYDHGELDRERIQEIVSKSMATINYLSTTIDDFRNFYRSDRQEEPFLITDTIKHALQLVDATLKSHSIQVVCHYKTPGPTVMGHKNQFAQALITLLNNATDALLARKNPKGQITITITEGKERVEVWIEDNGGGIAPETMDKIFDPYFTTKHQSQGTGVGLYTAKMIIERNMNGHIRAENRKTGARLIITLPRKSD